MRHYKNIRADHEDVVVGVPGTGGLVRLGYNDTMALCKTEDKHISGLCSQEHLKFVKDDDHDVIVKLITENVVKRISAMEDNLYIRIMKAMGKSYEEVVEIITTKEPVVITEEIVEELIGDDVTEVEEVAVVEDLAVDCEQCLQHVEPNEEGLCPMCGFNFFPTGGEIIPDVVTEDGDPDTSEYDEDGDALKGTDAWKNLSRSEKGAITKKRNKAAQAAEEAE